MEEVLVNIQLQNQLSYCRVEEIFSRCCGHISIRVTHVHRCPHYGIIAPLETFLCPEQRVDPHHNGDHEDDDDDEYEGLCSRCCNFQESEDWANPRTWEDVTRLDEQMENEVLLNYRETFGFGIGGWTYSIDKEQQVLPRSVIEERQRDFDRREAAWERLRFAEVHLGVRIRALREKDETRRSLFRTISQALRDRIASSRGSVKRQLRGVLQRAERGNEETQRLDIAAARRFYEDYETLVRAQDDWRNRSQYLTSEFLARTYRDYMEHRREIVQYMTEARAGAIHRRRFTRQRAIERDQERVAASAASRAAAENETRVERERRLAISSVLQRVEQPTETMCGICREDSFPCAEATGVVKTPCGHQFCDSCLESWINQSQNSCPYCRQPLSDEFGMALQMGD